MAPLPFMGQNISYSEQNDTINSNQISVKKETNEKFTDFNFLIYIPLLLLSLIYIITTLILFILCKKSKLMIIRDVNIYIYNTIAVIFLTVLLFFEAVFSDTSDNHIKNKIPNIIYIIVCAYSIPLWIFTNMVRVKKMEFRLKIQNDRLNNSFSNYDDSNVIPNKNKLHINVIQFQFYEKWSNYAIIGITAFITICLLIIYVFKKSILFDCSYIEEKCHTIILITIFLCMFYALYKKYKLRTYEETIGIQNEIKSIIIISLICSIGYIIFKLLSLKFKSVPVSIWYVIFFILYHTIIIVKPVFTVHIYQNKVESLHEKYNRHSIVKVKLSNDTDEANEMEINTFEKVLNPDFPIYSEFKKFLVGEVCIENLLFYEAIINVLLKCQSKITHDNSWNLKQLAENPNINNSITSSDTSNETKSVVLELETSETPYYEKLYKNAITYGSPEIKTQLINIYEKFIPEGSEYQLNLTSELVKQIEQKVDEDHNVDIQLFKPVLREVYELLRWTNYPRFLQTRSEK